MLTALKTKSDDFLVDSEKTLRSNWKKSRDDKTNQTSYGHRVVISQEELNTLLNDYKSSLSSSIPEKAQLKGFLTKYIKLMEEKSNEWKKLAETEMDTNKKQKYEEKQADYQAQIELVRPLENRF